VPPALGAAPPRRQRASTRSAATISSGPHIEVSTITWYRRRSLRSSPYACRYRRRAQPDAEIPVDQPSAQPAFHDDAAGARALDLHRVERPIDPGILFGDASHLREAQAAPTGLLAKHLTGRQVPQPQRPGERAGDGALSRPDLSAHGDDH